MGLGERTEKNLLFLREDEGEGCRRERGRAGRKSCFIW